ncbi:ATP-binding protein [Carboxydothermus ferrireducens]|uniref:ATPase n=1 Tax=Carboxydothermus ferrireducens DSM 11255 TaxID=1119529 RepID=A0ABX2R8U7_9THEO|nr:ATP-binding protein [Carboxydothermus ferrireducens]NYE57480.1 hypothetical protein [Carboxydothermus ferrireducens DSM 11255]
MKFVNRDEELSFLEKEYYRQGSSLVVIYGRRRVGKTTLIKEFIKNKPALYFLATEESEGENRKALIKLLGQFLNNELILKSDLSWEEIFKFFVKDDEKRVLVIDEFQYLGVANRAFPSILQKIWDSFLKEKNIMLILCGSLISLMESQTLSYSSPLYGRRTGQIKLQSIDFLHMSEFFPGKNWEEVLEIYAVTGGTPKYIEVFQEEKDIYQAIAKNILSKNSFLYEEPVFLLEKELRDIGSYFSIAKSIAAGNHKLGALATALGISQTGLTKYLKTLIELDILERITPITEDNPEKSKKGLYFLKDNFLDFWFKFVYPYKSFLEINEKEFVLRKIRESFIENHLSFVFEKVCQELLRYLVKRGDLNTEYTKIGKWWDRQTEIDVVGLNKDSGEIIFGECKYQNRKVGYEVYSNLIAKAQKVQWNKGKRNESFIIFSKEGFSSELIEAAKKNKNLYLFDFKNFSLV